MMEVQQNAQNKGQLNANIKEKLWFFQTSYTIQSIATSLVDKFSHNYIKLLIMGWNDGLNTKDNKILKLIGKQMGVILDNVIRISTKEPHIKNVTAEELHKR